MRRGAGGAVRRRVFVSTAPFGEADPRPLALLRRHRLEFAVNSLGRRFREEELARAIRDADVLIAGTEPITAAALAKAPRLRLISRVGVGLDNVDLLAARRRGVLVSYTPDAPAPAVAELTVGLILDLLRHVAAADRTLRRGRWRRFMGRRLAAVTVGVLGVGRIGRRVVEHLAGGFPGVRLLANDLAPDRAFGRRHGVRWVAKDALYRAADVVTVHLPLTPRTRFCLGAREFARMKPGALLVNTARGAIVREGDLARALRAGRLGGAAVDVFDREPYQGPLTRLENCLLTCHMGSMSRDCRARMELEATEEAVRFLTGRPLRALVPETEYALAAAARGRPGSSDGAAAARR